MGTSHSTAIEVVEKEFLRVQMPSSRNGSALEGNNEVEIFSKPRRNITHLELLQMNLPDAFRVDVQHIAVLFVLDANKDGLFSYDDIVAFINWVAATVPSDTGGSEMADAVQARCVLRMWKDCLNPTRPVLRTAGLPLKKEDPNEGLTSAAAVYFSSWCCQFLRTSYPCSVPLSGGRGKQVRRTPSFTLSSVPTAPLHRPLLIGRVVDDHSSSGDDVEFEGLTREQRDIQKRFRSPVARIPPTALFIPASLTVRDHTATDSGIEGGTGERDEDTCSSVFGVAATQALYSMLNVSEGYGLNFLTFCQVLGPPLDSSHFHAGVRSIHMSSINSTPGIQGSTINAPAIVLNSGGNSYVREKSATSAVTMSVNAILEEAHVRAALVQEYADWYFVTEDVLSSFLQAFVESYWNILKKLGCEVLL